jgi:hypothetical protein
VTSKDIPLHEVEENTTVTLTVDVPAPHITLLKDGQPIVPSDHVRVVATTSETTDIQIIKAKPDDDGIYSILIEQREQPLMQLKVIHKPVTHQIMDIPQTTFDEGDTLTIKCQFDAAPDESFEFLHNGEPLVNDDRITTTIENNTYTIVVKQLRPKEDDGVYTLRSPHLILDTPQIDVLPRKVTDTNESIETTVEIVESEEISVAPIDKSEEPEVSDRCRFSSTKNA